uniref:AMP-dependent synthetase/ligase domain-containing protein n=1 Tax=Timema genevievae TaxID=629358 RepID=A0A7R9K7V3_TIMGE|nr:unnamed protein product [Timema genevievae]
MFLAVLPTCTRYTPLRVVTPIYRTARRLTNNVKILKSPFGGVTIPDVSLTEYVWKDMQRWENQSAVTCSVTGESYTFKTLQSMSRSVSCALLGPVGLKPGDTIAMHLPNTPKFVVAMYGAIEAGLVVTFSNPLYTAAEITRQYLDGGVRCCVTQTSLLPVIQDVLPALPGKPMAIVVDLETHDIASGLFSLPQLVREAESTRLPSIDPGAVAILPYSSGTTGVPKGVKLSHKNLVSNLAQIFHPEIEFHEPTTDTRQERVLSVLPLFHIYGFNTILNQTVSKGIHLITMNKFTPEHYITALKQYKPTILFVVPSLLLFLASHPDVTQEHLSTVTNVMSGAAPAPKNLIEKFKAKVGRDLRVVQGYGMTESAPVTLIPRHKFPDSKVGSVGQITPVTEARVQDLTTREDLGPHQPGELLFRGPQVMLGYLNNEEATRQTLDKDGWLYTGDVGYYDEEGYFYIVDRTKELIKVKGNQNLFSKQVKTQLKVISVFSPEVSTTQHQYVTRRKCHTAMSRHFTSERRSESMSARSGTGHRSMGYLQT